MDFKNSVFQLYLKSRSEIANGFQDVDWIEDSFGLSFTWPRAEIDEANIIFITEDHQLDSNVYSKWLDNKNHKILSQGYDQIGNLEKSKSYTFLKRDAKKVNYPYLEGYSVGRYTYKDKNLSLNPAEQSRAISDLLQLPRNVVKEFDRYTGAILLILNGIVWTLENEDGNVLSICLTSELKTNKSTFINIEFLVTHSKFRKQGLAKNLLQVVLSNYRKSTISCLIPESSVPRKIADLFNFSNEYVLTSWKKAD